MADTRKTLEQFNATYGRGKQRRYYPPRKDVTNEKPYQMSEGAELIADKAVEEVPDFLKPVMRGMGDFNRASDQAQRNMASGILQIPSSVIGLADLVRAGGTAAVSAIPDRVSVDPETEKAVKTDYLKRLGDDFAKNMFAEGGQASLQEITAAKIGEFKAQKPDATPDEVNAFYEGWQDSDEYFDMMTTKLSPGFRLMQETNKWANGVAGVNLRPDEQTIVDDVWQTFGQSMIGLPPSAIKGIRSAMTKVVTENVLNSVPGKVATKAAELVTPLTLPLTPGNVAANTGVGVAIDEATRALSGSPGIINGPDQDVADAMRLSAAMDPPDGHGVDIGGQQDNTLLQAGISLGAFFAFPAFRRAASDAAAKSALTAGEAIVDQVDRLKPQLSPMTGKADAGAALTKVANKFEADTDTLDYIDAEYSRGAHASSSEAEHRALLYGIFENLPNGSIPFVEIDRSIRQLTPDDRELFNQYTFAKLRMQDVQAQAKSVDEEIRDSKYGLMAAEARGDNRAKTRYTNALTKLYETKQGLETDTYEGRTSMQQWSAADIRSFVEAGEASETLKPILDGIRRVSNDLTDYAHKGGIIDAEEAARRKTDAPFYVPRYPRARDEATGAKRAGLLLKDRIFGKPKDDVDMYAHQKDAPADAPRVNRPVTPEFALQEAIIDNVRHVTTNSARRSIIEALENLPGAQDTVVRAKQFDMGSGRTTEWLTPRQAKAFAERQLGKNADKYVSYQKDGLTRYVEFSDPSIKTALQFAPSSAVPIANATRKIWQQATTGYFAPWFPFKNTLWNLPVAKSTNRGGRSLGLLDTYGRMLANESPVVNAAGDFISDPTALISMNLAVPYQLSLRAARAVGKQVASDLQHNSGVFNMMAKVPGGKEYIEAIGTWMTQAYDRSLLATMHKGLGTNFGMLADASRIKDDYKVRGQGSTLGASFHAVIGGYRAAIEAVQQSVHTAFFVENAMREIKKNGGKPMSEKQLKSLLHETRQLTGDVSRQSNSPNIQKTASMIPYANTAMQSTRHILTSMVPPEVRFPFTNVQLPLGAKGINQLTGGKTNMTTNRSNKFWPQFTTGMVLPAFGAMSVLDTWSEAQDWWYNNTPEWERMSTIPFPTYDALLYRWQSGEWPEFSPDKFHKVPVPPEMMMILNPVMAGLRGLGLFGPVKDSVPGNNWLGATVEQVTNLATPPILSAAAAMNGQRLDLSKVGSGQMFQPINDDAFSGANADMMSPHSPIPHQLYDTIGALTGSAAQIALQTLSTGAVNYELTENVGAALDAALDTASYEVTRRFPNVPGLPGVSRNYAFTPESEYVYDTQQMLEPIIGNQRSIELDSKKRIPHMQAQGMIPPDKIKDPLLRAMVEEVNATINKKGPYKQATEQYTNLRADLTSLEDTRAIWPEKKYNEKYNEIVGQQQRLKSIQARILTGFEQQMAAKYDRVFKRVAGKPFTYQTFVDVVRQSVSE